MVDCWAVVGCRVPEDGLQLEEGRKGRQQWEVLVKLFLADMLPSHTEGRGPRLLLSLLAPAGSAPLTATLLLGTSQGHSLGTLRLQLYPGLKHGLSLALA